MSKNYLAIGLLALIGILAPSIVSYEMHQDKVRIEQPNTIKKSDLEMKLKSLDARYHANMNDYSMFKEWTEKAIENSRKNKSSLIIVDKAEHKLQIYNSGKITDTFPIELGYNPFDDKIKEGDGCTPEGFYKISVKKPEGNTFFYKALLINYPNKKDKDEFEKLKLEGKVNGNDSVGGLIEIHGEGSGFAGNKEGRNWTAGCISTSNDNMDLIFQKINAGADVLIVRY